MIRILFIFQSFRVNLWQLFSLAETILESSILEHILFCLFYRAHLVIESINRISFLKVWRTLYKIIFAWRESVSYGKLWWLRLEAVRSPGWCMFIVCYFIFVEGRGHLVYLVIELIARVSCFVIFTITDLCLQHYHLIIFRLGCWNRCWVYLSVAKVRAEWRSLVPTTIPRTFTFELKLIVGSI